MIFFLKGGNYVEINNNNVSIDSSLKKKNILYSIENEIIFDYI